MKSKFTDRELKQLKEFKKAYIPHYYNSIDLVLLEDVLFLNSSIVCSKDVNNIISAKYSTSFANSLQHAKRLVYMELKADTYTNYRLITVNDINVIKFNNQYTRNAPTIFFDIDTNIGLNALLAFKDGSRGKYKTIIDVDNKIIKSYHVGKWIGFKGNTIKTINRLLNTNFKVVKIDI